MTNQTELIEMAKESGADVIEAGEFIDQRYEGVRTVIEHYLFSKDELAKFAELCRNGEPVAYMPIKLNLTPVNHLGQLATRFNPDSTYCVPLYAGAPITNRKD